MTKPIASEYPSLPVKERIIAALDVPTVDEAREIVRQLRGEVGAFKIGSQLFTAAGPSLVREFTSADLRIFLDLKFHDIPNTVARAAVEAARLGVWMLNVHVLGGSEMMKRTMSELRSVCDKEGLALPYVTGVTILTSSTSKTLDEIGLGSDIEKQVTRLARLADECGLDGVVASPHEVRTIRQSVTRSDFLIVTPGIRPPGGTNDDQKRVKTFRQAVDDGADFAVVGRPIIEAVDRPQAVKKILEEMQGELNETK